VTRVFTAHLLRTYIFTYCALICAIASSFSSRASGAAVSSKLFCIHGREMQLLEPLYDKTYAVQIDRRNVAEVEIMDKYLLAEFPNKSGIVAPFPQVRQVGQVWSVPENVNMKREKVKTSKTYNLSQRRPLSDNDNDRERSIVAEWYYSKHGMIALWRVQVKKTVVVEDRIEHIYLVLCFVPGADTVLRVGWQCGYLIKNILQLAVPTKENPKILGIELHHQDRSSGSLFREAVNLVGTVVGGSGRSKAKKESSNVVAEKRSQAVRKNGSKSRGARK
jgi:hypothetical protein